MGIVENILGEAEIGLEIVKRIDIIGIEKGRQSALGRIVKAPILTTLDINEMIDAGRMRARIGIDRRRLWTLR